MKIISNVSHRLPLILGFICLNSILPASAQLTVTWFHNDNTFNPISVSGGLPLTSALTGISQETFGGGANATTFGTVAKVSGADPSTGNGYSSYRFTGTDDLILDQWNWGEVATGASAPGIDPDTGFLFTPHSYSVEVRISADNFVTSDLIGSTIVNQGGQASYQTRSQAISSYNISSGVEYEVRSFFLGPASGVDDNIVWDDFGLRFQPIPEVSTTMLLGLGGLLLALKRRR